MLSITCDSGPENSVIVTTLLWFFVVYIIVLLAFSLIWVVIRRRFEQESEEEQSSIEIELNALSSSFSEGASSDTSHCTRQNRSAARFTMVGHVAADFQAFQQTGYSQKALGLWVRRGWFAFIVATQMILFILTYLFYISHSDKYKGEHVRDFDCFFLPFASVYYPMACFFIVLGRLPFVEHWFLARCQLETATHVVISEIGGDMRNEVNVALVRVHDGSERWFVHMCTTYIWREDRFRPTGLTTFWADSVPSNGLSQESAESLLEWCRNSIDVEVPSFLHALVTEFSGGFYKFQLCGIWMFLWWSAQQEGFFVFLLAGYSGVMNAFMTRRLLVQVRDLVRNKDHVDVLRSDKWVNVSSSALVPGDAFRPAVGSVPCDCILVDGGAVANESMLTGDFIPLPKLKLEKSSIKVDSSTHRNHYLFAGTELLHVTHDVLCVATATGAATVSGRMIRNVLFPKPVNFALHQQLKYFYLLMMMYAIFCVLLYCSRKSPLEISLFSGTLLFFQALNPLFPVSLKAGEYISAQRLKKEGVRCLAPARIPMAGNLHAMVFDKTGTLTSQAMVFSGVCSATSDKVSTFVEPSELMRLGMGTCHTIKRIGTKLVGPSIDVSMLESSGWIFETEQKLCNGHQIARVLRILEFNHEQMTSGALVQTEDRIVLFVKGSYERCATMCSVAPNFLSTASQLAREAYYVLGIAYRDVRQDEVDELLTAPRTSLEANLIILGLLLFENPAKSDTLDVITELERGGVRSIMCSGDNIYTSIAVARKCGIVNGRLWVAGVVDGRVTWQDDIRKQEIFDFKSELRKGIELALDGAVFTLLRKSGDMPSLMPYVRVCAAMTPEQKVEVVEIIRSLNLVVGMCGDGGNDCAALRAAHVGVALSGAEASIVAPFSAGSKTCSSVLAVIKIGRASLETNLSLCAYWIGAGLVTTFAKLMQYFLDGVAFTEYQFLAVDIILPGLLTWGMASCCHNSKAQLAPYPLSSSPFSHGPLLAIFVSYGFWFVIYFWVRFLLFSQLWFFYLAPSAKDKDDSRYNDSRDTLEYLSGIFGASNGLYFVGDNYVTATIFVLLVAQLMSMALGMSVGGDHRRSAFRSWRLVFIIVVLAVAWCALLFNDETALSCTFRVNCSNRASLRTTWSFITDFSCTKPLGNCFFGPQFQIPLSAGGWWGCGKSDLASCYRKFAPKDSQCKLENTTAICAKEAETAVEIGFPPLEGYNITPYPTMCPADYPWAYGAMQFDLCCEFVYDKDNVTVNNGPRLMRRTGFHACGGKTTSCKWPPCYDFRNKSDVDFPRCVPPAELNIGKERAMRVDDEVVGPNNIFPITWKVALFVIAAAQSASILCFFSLLPPLLRRVSKKEKGLAELAEEDFEDWCRWDKYSSIL